ncbi:MAG TPA: PAS domain-containing protein [Solirubrobacteraceae bacterium]|nr:PAS domain-containing protein [Solirubrobacteraceae bacterium]
MSPPAAKSAWGRLVSALDGLDEPVVVLVEDSRPVHLNPAGAALTGLDPGELPGDLAGIASALPGRAGEAELIVLTAQHLDAALTTPEEHAESRRQLNQAQAVARIGSWTADMIERRVEFSDEQYRLYGLEPQSRHVDIHTFLSLIHPEDRAAMAAAADRAALKGEPFKLEHRLADAGSDVEWIEARCEPVLSRGRVVRMVGTCMDITERKRHEESLQASLAEVRASRIRIVSAADEERRRVERDLHDGAQQRLVSLTMALRVARTQLDEQAHPAVLATLEEISEELQMALAELRDLARGIHPAMLTERGLAPALESLVLRSPLPARVVACPDRRLPASLEIAIYYLAAEALTNAIKHAHASRVTISVSAEDNHVVVEVCDDGEGGARIAAGTGLRGLSDRVAALDGRLSIHSPPGAGTTLTAELPCE